MAYAAPKKIFTVFLSSTAADMTAYRSRVIDELDTLDNVKVVQAFTARGRRTVEECQRLAREADVLVVAVAHKYGWIPTVEEGGDGERSITRLEVTSAAENGKSVLAFLVDSDFGWTSEKESDLLVDADDDEAALAIHRRVRLLREFRAELNAFPRQLFRGPADLAAKVSSAVANETLMLSASLAAPDLAFQRAPNMAPPIRGGWIDRPDELAAIKRAVLGATASPVSITAKLQGAGGFGKTTLATMICHDPQIQAAFPDGLLWASLGQNPDLSSHVGRLCEELTGATRAVGGSRDEMGRVMGRALGDRRCLLVLDDVWKSEHLEPFTTGGPQCVRLITTRLRHVAPLATHVDIDHMTTEQATELLTRGLDRSDLDEDQLRSVAAGAGRWPLVLEQLAAQMAHRVREGADASSVLAAVGRRLANIGTRSSGGALAAHEEVVAKALSDNIALLAPEQRQQYAMLSVFAEDDDVDVGTVNRVWHYGNQDDAAELVERLSDLSLIVYDATNGSITLHDVVRDHLARRVVDRRAVHRALVSSWGDPLGLTDPFALRNIAAHMDGAGDTEALDALIDRPFLEHKTLVTRSRHGFVRDAEIARTHALGLDPPRISMGLRCALVHAHLLREVTRAPLEAIGVLGGVGDVGQARSLTALLTTPFERANAELAIAQRSLERHRIDQAATAVTNAIEHAKRVDAWDEETLLPRALRLAVLAGLPLVDHVLAQPADAVRAGHVAAIALGMLETGHGSAGSALDRLEEVLSSEVASALGDQPTAIWMYDEDRKVVIEALAKAGRTTSLETVLHGVPAWEVAGFLDACATTLANAGVDEVLLTMAATVENDVDRHNAYVAIAGAAIDDDLRDLAQTAMEQAAETSAALPTNEAALCMARRAVPMARLERARADELLARARLEVDAAGDGEVAERDVQVRLLSDETDDAIAVAEAIEDEERRDAAMLRIVDHFAGADRLDRAFDVAQSIQGDRWLEAVTIVARGHGRRGSASAAADLGRFVVADDRPGVLATAAAALFERGDDQLATQIVRQSLAALGRVEPLVARPAAFTRLATAMRSADAASGANVIDELSRNSLDMLGEPVHRAEALRQLITGAGDSPDPAAVEALEAVMVGNSELADDEDLVAALLAGVALSCLGRLPGVLETLLEAMATGAAAMNTVHATIAAIDATPHDAWTAVAVATAHQQAITAARRIGDPPRRLDLLLDLALSFSAAGERRIASEIGRELEHEVQHAVDDVDDEYFHVALAQLWAAVDDEERSLDHVKQCETVEGHDRALAGAATGLGQHRPRRAVELTNEITAPYRRDVARAGLVLDLARHESTDAAVSLVGAIDDAELRARSTLELVGMLLDQGHDGIDTAASLRGDLDLEWALDRHRVLLAKAEATNGAAVDDVDERLVPLRAQERVDAFMEIIDALVGGANDDGLEPPPAAFAFLTRAEHTLAQMDDDAARAWTRVGTIRNIARLSGDGAARAAADELSTSEMRVRALVQIAEGLAARGDRGAVIAAVNEALDGLDHAEWADPGVVENQLVALVAPMTLVEADDQVVGILNRIGNESRIRDAFTQAAIARHKTAGVDAALHLAALLPTRVGMLDRAAETLQISAIAALVAADQRAVAGELAESLHRGSTDAESASVGLLDIAQACAQAGRWDLVLDRVGDIEDRFEALELLAGVGEDMLGAEAPPDAIADVALRLIGELDDVDRSFLSLDLFVSSLAAAGALAAALDVASAADVDVDDVVRGAVAAQNTVTVDHALQQISGRSDPAARTVRSVLRALRAGQPISALLAALEDLDVVTRVESVSAIARSFAGQPDRSERERALELGRSTPDVMVDVAEFLLVGQDHVLARIAVDEALRGADLAYYDRARATGVKLRIAASERDLHTVHELLDEWSAELDDDDLVDAASRFAEPRLLAELVRRAGPEPDQIYALLQAIADPLVDMVGEAEATELAQALFAADQWAGSPTAGVRQSSAAAAD